MTPDEFCARWDEMLRREAMQATCQHVWSEPVRANNRFGRRSTSLYETICTVCGKREVRNGKSRLKAEVIDCSVSGGG